MSNKKTILLVDDDANLIDSLKLRCSALGLNVKTAHNALTAVKLIDETKPDLVCLDVHMPTGNGLAICEAMNTDPATASIPVIIMTSDHRTATIKKCGDLCAYYIRKSGDLWRRMEPVIEELIDIEPTSERKPWFGLRGNASRTAKNQ